MDAVKLEVMSGDTFYQSEEAAPWYFWRSRGYMNRSRKSEGHLGSAIIPIKPLLGACNVAIRSKLSGSIAELETFLYSDSQHCVLPESSRTDIRIRQCIFMLEGLDEAVRFVGRNGRSGCH